MSGHLQTTRRSAIQTLEQMFDACSTMVQVISGGSPPPTALLRHGERPVTPPGWPTEVRPPDASRWEETAIGWLLDQCPPEYRLYEGLRRHPLVLARFTLLHVQASIQAAQRGISEARVSLRDVLPTEVVEGAVRMWEREGARLLKLERAVGLVEEALRGRRFRARL